MTGVAEKSYRDSIVLAGKTGDLLRTIDWKGREPGPVETWPVHLLIAASICMNSKFPMLVLWGDDFSLLYNDACAKLVGKNHPSAMGKKAEEVWPEIWETIGPMLRSVKNTGVPTWSENQLLVTERNGYKEECYFTFSFSPVFSVKGSIDGVFAAVTETTSSINNELRLKSQRNRQLSNLFLQAPLAMAILRGPELVVEVANVKMLEIWGKSHERMIGKPIFTAMPDAKGQGFEELLRNVYTTGVRVVNDEQLVQLVRNNKTEKIYVKFVYEPLREEDGSISAVMVVADEITDHVQVRQKMEENESRTEMALEAARIGTFELNLNTNEFIYSNRLRQIFGIKDPGTLSHDAFQGAIHPADMGIRNKALSDAMKTGILMYEARIITNGGSIRWVRFNGKVVLDESSKPFKLYGTAIDITREKTIMQELEESEKRFRNFADNTPVMIWTTGPDGKFDFFNKPWLTYTGREMSAEMGHGWYEGIHPDDRVHFVEIFNKAFKTKTEFAIEYRLRSASGEYKWMSDVGTPRYFNDGSFLGYIGSAFDIDERKKNREILEQKINERTHTLLERNEALKKSEERYHKMIEEVQDYAIILLDRDGTILNWNKGAEKIKGYSERDIIGKNFRIFYLPEDRQRMLPEKLISLALENGRAMHEGWRVRKDGTRFWGSIVITALHNEAGETIGFSKVTRDLTDKKNAEDRMQQYLSELEFQNRELEQFAYVASHDLQEPLRKIQTFSGLIEENIENVEIRERYFKKLNSSAKRMSNLIRDVLNYSRLSRIHEEFEPVDLNEVLENVETDFELLIQEKGGKIIHERLPVIQGIPLQLNQLFSNLINNSLKFSDKSPEIRISTRFPDEKEIEKIDGLQPETKYAELIFSDNGIGFEQKYADQIFTIFQRLHKRDYTGTGIGLALCKKIVENHHGDITATSIPGSGTTFRVYLPLEQQ